MIAVAPHLELELAAEPVRVAISDVALAVAPQLLARGAQAHERDTAADRGVDDADRKARVGAGHRAGEQTRFEVGAHFRRRRARHARERYLAALALARDEPHAPDAQRILGRFLAGIAGTEEDFAAHQSRLVERDRAVRIAHVDAAIRGLEPGARERLAAVGVHDPDPEVTVHRCRDGSGFEAGWRRAEILARRRRLAAGSRTVSARSVATVGRAEAAAVAVAASAGAGRLRIVIFARTRCQQGKRAAHLQCTQHSAPRSARPL